MVPRRKVGRKRIRLPAARCYSLTLFTKKWREVRHFYTHLLGAVVISERAYRYCELRLGGVPLCFRTGENGESMSYFHLYLALQEQQLILERLQNAGVIVRLDGTYACFLDPEGRTIKLSKDIALLE
jgi:catechol 2,3-dioxygenase-like lactoylglutathione lyase family enzyme